MRRRNSMIWARDGNITHVSIDRKNRSNLSPGIAPSRPYPATFAGAGGFGVGAAALGVMIAQTAAIAGGGSATATRAICCVEATASDLEGPTYVTLNDKGRVVWDGHKCRARSAVEEVEGGCGCSSRAQGGGGGGGRSEPRRRSGSDPERVGNIAAGRMSCGR